MRIATITHSIDRAPNPTITAGELRDVVVHRDGKMQLIFGSQKPEEPTIVVMTLSDNDWDNITAAVCEKLSTNHTDGK